MIPATPDPHPCNVPTFCGPQKSHRCSRPAGHSGPHACATWSWAPEKARNAHHDVYGAYHRCADAEEARR